MEGLRKNAGTSKLSAAAAEALDQACEAAMAIEGAPLTGLGLVLVSGGERIHEGYFGARRLSAEGGGKDEAFTATTLLRVASISKPVVALGLFRLVERGLVDLDADLSEYLGFRLRNPAYPDVPISARMLISHVSSLRDAGFYYPPLGRNIRELLEPDGMYWAEGAHFARPVSGGQSSPGRRYAYCNLGYGLVGTAIERVAGERFDRYMAQEVFDPLGIDGGFNPALLGDRAFAGLSPIYRKGPEGDEVWDSGEAWRPEIDDYPKGRPEEFVRREPGSQARLSDYAPGSNGALFSPQGGMRISAPDLARIALVFLGKGEAPEAVGVPGGVPRRAHRLVSAETVAQMTTPVWRRGAPGLDAEEASDHVLATGSGLMLAEGPLGREALWGHHGSAYGFLGGMYLDFERNAGYVYLIGGTSRDPETFRRPGCGMSLWEEGIRTAAEAVISRI